LVLGLAVGAALVGEASAKQKDGPVLFDVIYLQEGHEAQEAVDYFEKVSAISKRHGLVRLKTYRIDKALKGVIAQPTLINLWRMDRPDAMQKMGADPEYQRLVPTRDALFDMGRVSILMGAPL
jgi:hypothetical protein